MKRKFKKFLKSKSGVIITTTLVKITILMLSFMLIGGSIARFASKAGEKDTEAICRVSVDARVASITNAKLLGLEVEGVKSTPLLCRTIDKKLSGKKEKVMDDLAEMISNCWWMFRQGETADLFKSIPGVSGNNKGMVCYTALIKDIEEADYITGLEFLTYLSKKSHPDMGPEEYYTDYIQYSGGPGRILLLLNQRKGEQSATTTENWHSQLNEGKSVGGVFQENNAYEIIFIEKRGEENDWISTALLRGGSAAAVGGGLLVWAGVATGWVGLIVYGVGALALGTYSAVQGGVIEFENLFSQKDVGTLLVADISDKNLQRQLHRKVIIDDAAGN